MKRRSGIPRRVECTIQYVTSASATLVLDNLIVLRSSSPMTSLSLQTVTLVSKVESGAVSEYLGATEAP